MSVLVLEQQLHSDPLWKSYPLGRRGLNIVGMEAFYRRGLQSQVFENIGNLGKPTEKGGFQFGGHFAGLPLNANQLDLSRYRWRLPGPALYSGRTYVDRVEAVLSVRAESLGVEIKRGEGFSQMEGHGSGHFKVSSTQGRTYTGRWLVGCDGGRSSVRKAAGIAFDGSEPRMTGYAAKCAFDHPERLKPGFHVTDNGLCVISPDSLYMMDADVAQFDRSQNIDRDYLQTVFRRISGIEDVEVSQLDYASTFTDACRQASAYRNCRILLAGDAAHVHSPLGGQGLNAGIGDAINLGWKLSATVRREKQTRATDSLAEDVDTVLLDTYEMERRPEAARVLEWSRAQVLALEPGPYGHALRNLLQQLLATDDGANHIINQIWGLSQNRSIDETPGSQSHQLLGRSVPDYELEDGSRIGERLRSGRGLMINPRAYSSLRNMTEGFESTVEHIDLALTDSLGIDAILVRPDGVVAWVTTSDEEPDTITAKAAFDKWFAF